MNNETIETLAPIPLLDLEALPHDSHMIGEYSLPNYNKGRQPLKFIIYKRWLVIAALFEFSLVPHGEKLERDFVDHFQVEFPIQAARWFVEAIRRCFLPPGDPRAMKPGAMAILEKVNGEWLHLTRGFHSGGHNIPGYSFSNVSRLEHDEQPMMKQSLEIGDPEIFDRIDGKPVISPDKFAGFMERIAERYESGEFGPPVPVKIEDSMW
ncbi:hypothetical protein AAIA72_12980 [Hahella sp. SMD15-11]|uniref:Uncharacterized protein n=1 Tax=Thermohahella caldifontis TaxID=3142973 RepID=A0AB39UUP4_9GAMM